MIKTKFLYENPWNFFMEKIRAKFDSDLAFRYIDSQNSLFDIAKEISQSSLITVDTEFCRKNTYYPILSIIQIRYKNLQGKKNNVIIDCMKDIDISPIFDIINNPKIKKIFHSAIQDLQIFYYLSKKIPQNIVDTQIMANFCGFGFNAGYSKLVKRILNIRIDKDLQNSEWRIRPLTYSQLKYAISDVIYLEEIYNSFIKTINSKRLAWYEEEMNRFIGKLSYQGIENLSRNFSFIKKNDIQISQTKKLIMLRENISKRINVPRQRFLKDIHIEFIVEYKEITNDIINKNNIKYIDDIREIINSHEVIKTEYVDLSMSSEQKNIFLQAKKFINKISFQENFQEQFLISNLDLKKIICEKELFGKIVSGWRYQVFGNDLEKIINKKNYENVYC